VPLDSSLGNKRDKLAARGDDLYETPAVAVHALMGVERLPRKIWEPACGPGAIVRVLRDAGHTVYASDLRDYGCPESEAGCDFLLERRAWMGAEAIITNPPFKLAARFAEKAIGMVPRVYFLLRLAFLEGGNSRSEAGQARRFALDGGHLARVWVFRKRLPMMHRAGWEGRKANSGMAFAWFVWDREHRCDHYEVRRVSWEDHTPAEAA
jgi:hypothetical protein